MAEKPVVTVDNERDLIKVVKFLVGLCERENAENDICPDCGELIEPVEIN